MYLFYIAEINPSSQCKLSFILKLNHMFWMFLVLANVQLSLENCPLDANKKNVFKHTNIKFHYYYIILYYKKDHLN